MKLANTINQDYFLFFSERWLLNIYQHNIGSTRFFKYIGWSQIQLPPPVALNLLRNVNYNTWSVQSRLWFSQQSCMDRRRQWHPTPVLLPGESHGQRSLVGCRPWGLEELETTERLHFHFTVSCIGEGNGNPLQCSCLENPREGGAWWAAVYGVAQSRTRLK